MKNTDKIIALFHKASTELNSLVQISARMKGYQMIYDRKMKRYDSIILGLSIVIFIVINSLLLLLLTL